jgi:hypothetical protein
MMAIPTGCIVWWVIGNGEHSTMRRCIGSMVGRALLLSLILLAFLLASCQQDLRQQLEQAQTDLAACQAFQLMQQCMIGNMAESDQELLQEQEFCEYAVCNVMDAPFCGGGE